MQSVSDCRMNRGRTVSLIQLLVSIATSGCATYPTTKTLQPEFEIATSAGAVSVVIRNTLPEMTLSEFKHAIAEGIKSAIPNSQPANSAVEPYSTRRIVW